VFVDQLFERGEDRDGLWAFSEVTEGKINLNSWVLTKTFVFSNLKETVF
jgi:hypothetical protein